MRLATRAEGPREHKRGKDSSLPQICGPGPEAKQSTIIQDSQNLREVGRRGRVPNPRTPPTHRNLV